MKLTKAVYELCELLPSDEKYGICSQIKRSAVSVPSNIAEGYRRRNPKEFIQFLGIASGSCAELETQLILISDIFNKNTDQLQADAIEIQKMLSGLTSKINKRPL